MATRKMLYWPLEGTLKDDLLAWLEMSELDGQPLPGLEEEWALIATRIITGLRSSLVNNETLEIAAIE